MEQVAAHDYEADVEDFSSSEDSDTPTLDKAMACLASSAEEDMGEIPVLRAHTVYAEYVSFNAFMDQEGYSLPSVLENPPQIPKPPRMAPTEEFLTSTPKKRCSSGHFMNYSVELSPVKKVGEWDAPLFGLDSLVGNSNGTGGTATTWETIESTRTKSSRNSPVSQCSLLEQLGEDSPDKPAIWFEETNLQELTDTEEQKMQQGTDLIKSKTERGSAGSAGVTASKSETHSNRQSTLKASLIPTPPRGLVDETESEDDHSEALPDVLPQSENTFVKMNGREASPLMPADEELITAGVFVHLPLALTSPSLNQAVPPSIGPTIHPLSLGPTSPITAPLNLSNDLFSSSSSLLQITQISTEHCNEPEYLADVKLRMKPVVVIERLGSEVQALESLKLSAALLESLEPPTHQDEDKKKHTTSQQMTANISEHETEPEKEPRVLAPKKQKSRFLVNVAPQGSPQKRELYDSLLDITPQGSPQKRGLYDSLLDPQGTPQKPKKQKRRLYDSLSDNTLQEPPQKQEQKKKGFPISEIPPDSLESAVPAQKPRKRELRFCGPEVPDDVLDVPLQRRPHKIKIIGSNSIINFPDTTPDILDS